MDKYYVSKIESKDTYPFLLEIHYARRIPSISCAFGLFYDKDLVGIVTYGTPASSTLRNGIAGRENAHRVLELNRLCLKNNIKNEASFLVARSLRALPKRTIVVSYADTAQNHIGYVYQACNFKYTGLSAKRTDWKIRGMEHLHGQTIADMSRGQKNRSAFLRSKFGDAFYLHPRSRKHRYVYIVGRRPDYNVIKYKQIEYPKVTNEKLLGV